MAHKHIRDLLAASTAAAKALTEQERDRALLDRIRRQLPAEARGHCISADRTQGRLVLVFDSPAWTTRARFQAAEVAESMGLSEVTVRTRPAQPPRTDRRRSRRPRNAPTMETIANLLATAEAISDPGLREALQHLAHQLATKRPPT